MPELAPFVIIDESQQQAFNLLTGVKNLDEYFVIVELDSHRANEIEQVLKQADKEKVRKT